MAGAITVMRASGRPKLPQSARNANWFHMVNDDMISMPDKWEYPWYAAWDLAFHTIALDAVDPDFAKDQLLLMMKEVYLHPNGQIPGLRMELRRRKSSGPCLCGHVHLPDRQTPLW